MDILIGMILINALGVALIISAYYMGRNGR